MSARAYRVASAEVVIAELRRALDDVLAVECCEYQCATAWGMEQRESVARNHGACPCYERALEQHP
jgi:hypothetical protein